jgi:hypothetical protein
MENQAKNKLIVEFMGIKPINVMKDVWAISKQPWVSVTENSAEKAIETFCKSLKYHTDWSWLMPVVEKINDLGYNVRFDMQDYYVINNDAEIAVEPSCGSETWIEGVYGIVVDFIEWHNQNK